MTPSQNGGKPWHGIAPWVRLRGWLKLEKGNLWVAIIYSVAIGLSTAATAVVARRIGEKNPEAAAHVGLQDPIPGKSKQGLPDRAVEVDTRRLLAPDDRAQLADDERMSSGKATAGGSL